MKYGIIHLSIVPIRLEPSDTSEMVTQALYGESIKILEQRKKWSRIRLMFDGYEGWMDNKQFTQIEKDLFEEISSETPILSADLVNFITNEVQQLQSVVLGSNMNVLSLLNHQFEGHTISGQKPKSALVDTALLYLNTPYLWGGKSPFGIDCSGFSQMVYKLNGYQLKRDASQQATQGEALSFIEESEPGDLAFFDNSEGIITHVGIILKDHHIIHAHGHVRVDRIDHTGIFNVDTKQYSHKLRVIKKII